MVKSFWDGATLVCKASGCYGTPFKAKRGVTQGGPASPTIFNIMVDAILRKWERQLILEGIPLGQVRVLVAIFYADDGLIAARNSKHLQTAIDLLTALFDRVGLQTNTTKTEAMIFMPGKIRTSLSE